MGCLSRNFAVRFRNNIESEWSHGLGNQLDVLQRFVSRSANFHSAKEWVVSTSRGCGVQGHEGQFLAILAQSRVPANYPLQIGGKQYTVEDLIDYEMRTCKAKTELTFKLIALSHYLINDATWVNDQGEEWSLETLGRRRIGSTNYWSGMRWDSPSYGVEFCSQAAEVGRLPIDGQYARAEVFLKDFIDYAWTLQNPDGSFSTEWFEGRGNKQDLQRKLQTTGHIVEWLVFTLPDEELQSPLLASLHPIFDLLFGRTTPNRLENWTAKPCFTCVGYVPRTSVWRDDGNASGIGYGRQSKSTSLTAPNSD